MLVAHPALHLHNDEQHGGDFPLEDVKSDVLVFYVLQYNGSYRRARSEPRGSVRGADAALLSWLTAAAAASRSAAPSPAHNVPRKCFLRSSACVREGV